MFNGWKITNILDVGPCELDTVDGPYSKTGYRLERREDGFAFIIDLKEGNMRIKISDIGSFIVVVLVVCAFWLFLFQGIMAEQDRRLATVPMQQPELMKAMRQAAK